MATSKTKIERAMILAAGYGTRLLPITEKIPKPMAPVLNIPNILFPIYALKTAGVSKFLINLHHLPEEIVNYLGDGEHHGISIDYSEERTLLGTGGGLKKAEAFFQKQPFVLSNSDYVCNVSLKDFFAKHSKKNALATMVLYKNENLQPFYSKVGITAEGELCQLPELQTRSPVRTGIFTGIHVLSPKIFEWLKPEFSGINQVLYPHLMKNFPKQTFGQFLENEYWYDTGDLNAYWTTSMELLQRLDAGDKFLRGLLKWQNYEQVRPKVWAFRTTKIPSHTKIQGPVILGPSCQLEDKCEIGPNAIVGAQSHLGVASQLKDIILLPGSQIPEKAQWDSAVIFDTHRLSTYRRFSSSP